MPPSRAALNRYRTVIAAQRAKAGKGLAVEFGRIDTYDKAAARSYIKKVAPLLEGAKAATVRTSAAYIATVLGIETPKVNPNKVRTTAALRDPFTAMWHALSQGRPYAEAVQVGRSVASASGESYIQSTARQAGDVVAAAAERKVRWVRVAEPGACDWCADLDGKVFGSAADGDFGHERCHCDVIPQS